MENYIVDYNILISIIVPAAVTLATLFITELVKKKHSRDGFKFTKLHEKRLEVLAKTYEYINEQIELLQDYVHPTSTTSYTDDVQLDVKYKTLTAEFLVYFNSHAIYFDEKMETLIRDYFRESNSIYYDHFFSKNIADLNITKERSRATTDLNSFVEVHKKLVPIKTQIEKKFRILLGN